MIDFTLSQLPLFTLLTHPGQMTHSTYTWYSYSGSVKVYVSRCLVVFGVTQRFPLWIKAASRPWAVLVRGWEFAFKLHRPHRPMHCTWRSTEGTETSNDILLLEFTNKQQTTTIYDNKTNKSLFAFFPPYLSAFYSLKLEPSYRAVISHGLQRWKLQLYLAIWFHLWQTEVLQTVLYDRFGQRLRGTCYIALRGVSLTFIDQPDPLPHLLPTFAVVELIWRKQNTSYLTVVPYVLPGWDRDALKYLYIRK